MNIFIDTEFNEFGGELISMALVSGDDVFYEVLHCAEPKAWVKEHVMPVLEKKPVTKAIFQARLAEFLSDFQTVHLIADWPDDIKYFCDILTTGPGERIDTPPLTMQILRNIDSSNSFTPHNALSDANALQLDYEAKKLR
jgi:hypothetical protein